MKGRFLQGAVLTALALGAGACVEHEHTKPGTFRMNVTVTEADGSAVPGSDMLACVDLRGTSLTCTDGGEYIIGVTAITPDGTTDETFNGYVRIDVDPGSIAALTGDAVLGRNVLLQRGVVASDVHLSVTGSYGPTHVLAQDIGYAPVDPLQRAPGCANGLDDDGDGLIDFPADPGCAYANDDTETGGTFAEGASQPIYYDLPTVAEAQGLGPATPFDNQGVQIKVIGDDINVIVNRVSASGFYVTDSNVSTDSSGATFVAAKDYGSLYVFNFGVPNGVRVCDKVTFLSGTMSEFFGYTEMGFPSFEVHPWVFPTVDANGNVTSPGDGPCLLPQPTTISANIASDDAELEKVEAGLVRVFGAHVAQKLGPGQPAETIIAGAPGCSQDYTFDFTSGATSCDRNGDGKVSFTACGEEADCANQCEADPECSEWTDFSSRGTFRIVLPGATAGATESPSQTMNAVTSTVGDFRPQLYLGRVLPAITGTLANFSGGKQNWSIEVRCPDDIVICADGDTTCEATIPTPDQLDNINGHLPCVDPRSQADNDASD